MADRWWPYDKVVFAGTFDHLHEGHKHLLRTALSLGQHVAVGLTTQKLLQEKDMNDKMESYQEREEALWEFLESEEQAGRCTIFPINTVEGGADEMEDLDALIVSDEIRVVKNAFRINDLRAENNLKRFHIIVVPRVRTKDGRPLSSSRRRKGEKFDGVQLIY